MDKSEGEDLFYFCIFILSRTTTSPIDRDTEEAKYVPVHVVRWQHKVKSVFGPVAAPLKKQMQSFIYIYKKNSYEYLYKNE